MIWYRQSVRVAALTLGLLGAAGPAFAQALECPAPQPLQHPGVLRESAAQVRKTANLLASGDDSNRIRVIADDLRRRYPGVENAELENYLVTAYCPVAARLTGLSLAERQARVERFAHEADVAVHQH